MSMRIWLKTSVSYRGYEEGLRRLREQGDPGMPVMTDEHGAKYLVVNEDIFDPTARFNVWPEAVERVTLKERIHRGFRSEGLYRHEATTLLVRTRLRVHPTGEGKKVVREEWQDISVSAPSVHALMTIYTLVREGKLSPDKNWDGDTPSVPPSQPQEVASEAPAT